MRTMANVIAILFTSSLVACAHDRASANSESQAPPASTASSEAASPSAASDALPPAVLSATGHLNCTISSKANGRQELTLSSGQGLAFDVAVSPIIDGVVQAKGPDKGGSYRFTSHLVGKGKGSLSGVGDVEIESLDTRVMVEMSHYKQPGGRGTELSFASEDMAAKGIYVEFAGRAKAPNGDHYSFRVTLGAPGPGSGGSVKPATDADQAPIMSKMVVIQAPQTTVVTTLEHSH